MIQYEVSDQKAPVYGYNDRTWRRIAIGRTIVQGVLGIRFVYEGYLKRVLDRIRSDHGTVPKSSEEARLSGLENGQDISDDLLLQEADRVLGFLDDASRSSGGMRAYYRAAAFLKRRFSWDGPTDYTEVSIDDITGAYLGADSKETEAEANDVRGYMRPSLYHGSGSDAINLRIVHGPDRNVGNPAFARDIVDVHFTGQSYVADIDLPGGERVCSELYPFIAKDVKPIPIKGGKQR